MGRQRLGDLRMMYDTLAVMHSRVTKLELDLSAITRV